MLKRIIRRVLKIRNDIFWGIDIFGILGWIWVILYYRQVANMLGAVLKAYDEGKEHDEK